VVTTSVFGHQLFCPAPDLCLTSDHFVGKLSAIGQPTSKLSLPSLMVWSMSSNPCIYNDQGGDDH